jgi:hypothetical protein
VEKKIRKEKSARLITIIVSADLNDVYFTQMLKKRICEQRRDIGTLVWEHQRKNKTFNISARECPFIRPQECRPRGRGTVLGPAIKVKIYESRNLGRDNVVGNEGGGRGLKRESPLKKDYFPPGHSRPRSFLGSLKS